MCVIQKAPCGIGLKEYKNELRTDKTRTKLTETTLYSTIFLTWTTSGNYKLEKRAALNLI